MNKNTQRLILDDCLSAMDMLPACSVDMVLSDMPYVTSKLSWDTTIPLTPMWDRLKRVVKPRAAVILFGVEPFNSLLRTSNIGWFRYDWLWVKPAPNGFLNAKKQPLRKTETISVFSKQQANYYPVLEKCHPFKTKVNTSGYQSGLHGSVSEYDKPQYAIRDFKYPNNLLFFDKVLGNRRHPTEKPVALLQYLINTYSLGGDTVLDFCMGSGSVGVACANTGRRFIGIEKDQKYYDIAVSRLAR